MTEPRDAVATPAEDTRFQRTLIRVLVVQAVALVLLGALQAIYNL